MKKWLKQIKRYVQVYLKSKKNRCVGDVDVVVCSPGGVATTMLLHHISCFLRTNDQDDVDSLKHVPDPKLLISDDGFRGRILYIYGEVDSIVASIERRGWIRIQGAKLGSMSSVLLPRNASRNAFRKAVLAQIETFQVCTNQRLKSLHFEDIWDDQAGLGKFLDIDDPKFIEDFPKRKHRQTEAVRIVKCG